MSTTKQKGRARKKPGMGGRGNFYRIQIRPKTEFVTFRTQDVGDEGHLERLAGKRRSGSWDTQAWLVSKEDAHVDREGHLVIDDPGARTALDQIRGEIVHEKGDIFSALPRRNIKKARRARKA